jgi:hypothetical protein
MRAGDAEATETLFERHGETLRARVQRSLPHVTCAKLGASDVIQDAWPAVCMRLPDLEDPDEGSFARRLNGIVEGRIPAC